MSDGRLWDYSYTAVGIGRQRETRTLTEEAWGRFRGDLNRLGWTLLDVDRRPHGAPPAASRAARRAAPWTTAFTWLCGGGHSVIVVCGRVPVRRPG
jgi:hypothetical protein